MLVVTFIVIYCYFMMGVMSNMLKSTLSFINV